MAEPATDMDAQVFAAVTKLAQLTLSSERLEQLAPAALQTMRMIRSVSDLDLKETAPATAFKASWE